MVVCLYGTTWVRSYLKKDSLKGDIVAITPDPLIPGTVYAGLYLEDTDLLWKSTDYGSSWISINEGITTGTFYSDVGAIEVNPLEANIVFAGIMYSGSYRSDDGGVSWRKLDLTPGIQVLYWR